MTMRQLQRQLSARQRKDAKSSGGRMDHTWEEMYEVACRELALAREQRDELRTALRDLCDALPMETLQSDPPLEAWWRMAQDAIAKVDGE